MQAILIFVLVVLLLAADAFIGGSRMAELKKCPFCGSDNVAFTPDEEQLLEDTTTGFIWCHGCDFSSDSFYSEEIAAEKWNRREKE